VKGGGVEEKHKRMYFTSVFLHTETILFVVMRSSWRKRGQRKREMAREQSIGTAHCLRGREVGKRDVGGHGWKGIYYTICIYIYIYISIPKYTLVYTSKDLYIYILIYAIVYTKYMVQYIPKYTLVYTSKKEKVEVLLHTATHCNTKQHKHMNVSAEKMEAQNNLSSLFKFSCFIFQRMDKQRRVVCRPFLAKKAVYFEMDSW